MLKKTLFLLFLAICDAKNNACKFYHDYPIMDISENCYKDLDFQVPVPILAQRHGYGVETHFVTTVDGYILQIIRIFNKNELLQNKQPVVLEHGIILNSEAWFLAGQKSIVYSLLKDGYDVWLSNHRGTSYSKKHVSLDDKNPKYWKFSLDTTAANDMSPILNRVAEVTGQAGNIIYIGHSRGATVFFMYASEYPEESERLLKGVIGISPIVYMDPEVNVAIGMLSSLPVSTILKHFGMNSLFSIPEPIRLMLVTACSHFPAICVIFLFSFSGLSNQLPPNIMLNFFSRYPEPIAMDEMIHLTQLYAFRRFQKYDYGVKNHEVYFQERPPSYNLSKITIPVYAFYGGKDIMLSKQSVRKFINELGSTKKDMFRVPVGLDIADKDDFNHNDFYWAKNLTEYFYVDLIRVLKEELQPNSNQ